MKKKMMLCGILFRSVSSVEFSVKAAFLESVSLHSEMIGATNFGLVLVHGIVIKMFFIWKLFMKSWYEF